LARSFAEYFKSENTKGPGSFVEAETL